MAHLAVALGRRAYPCIYFPVVVAVCIITVPCAIRVTTNIVSIMLGVVVMHTVLVVVLIWVAERSVMAV